MSVSVLMKLRLLRGRTALARRRHDQTLIYAVGLSIFWLQLSAAWAEQLLFAVADHMGSTVASRTMTLATVHSVTISLDLQLQLLKVLL